MIDLPDITLVSLIWDKSQEHMDRTVRVFNYMNTIADFADAILFGACRPTVEPVGTRFVQVPVMDRVGWQIFQMRFFSGFILSRYMMQIHDDGFIIRPDLWRSGFLNWDYIGAPWHDGVVGNDGFCIQSKKFLATKSKMPFNETLNGDEFLCRDNRALMVERGIRFAPTDIAALFATEATHCDQPSFGFHGRVHAVDKFNQGWKLIEEWEASQK